MKRIVAEIINIHAVIKNLTPGLPSLKAFTEARISKIAAIHPEKLRIIKLNFI
ncbi:MAG TPA: hypothetical protein P5120_17975 [Spirochaetota bacterium]|nr:hypothetical protein [Spirochaetota bacterium]